jgi:hypothetical protein
MTHKFPPYYANDFPNKKMTGRDGNVWKSVKNKQHKYYWKLIKSTNKKKPIIYNFGNYGNLIIKRNNSQIIPKKNTSSKITLDNRGHFHIKISSFYIKEANEVININARKLINLSYKIIKNILIISFYYKENLYEFSIKFTKKYVLIPSVIIDILLKCKAKTPITNTIYNMDIIKSHHYGTLIKITKKIISKLDNTKKYYVIEGNKWYNDYTGKCISLLDVNDIVIDKHTYIIDTFRNGFRLEQ